MTGKENIREKFRQNLDNSNFRDGVIPSLQVQEWKQVPHFSKVVLCWGEAGNHGGNCKPNVESRL